MAALVQFHPEIHPSEILYVIQSDGIQNAVFDAVKSQLKKIAPVKAVALSSGQQFDSSHFCFVNQDMRILIVVHLPASTRAEALESAAILAGVCAAVSDDSAEVLVISDHFEKLAVSLKYL